MSLDNKNKISEKELAPEKIPLEDQKILDIPVCFGDKGKAVSVQTESGNAEVRVNRDRFTDKRLALRAGALQAGYLSALQSNLQDNPKQFLKELQILPYLNDVLRMQGIKKLQNEHAEIISKITQIAPQVTSLRKEFANACEEYLLSGNWPDEVSPEVQQAIDALPVRNGKNVLDFIVSGRLPATTCDEMYRKYILPRYTELQKAEKQYSRTESGNYIPPTDTGEERPMEEAEIESKVEPFWGGYYRGRIENYDRGQECLVFRSIPKETFIPENLPEDLENHKKYTFSGVYHPGKENILELPYYALPLPDTLEVEESENLTKKLNKRFKTSPLQIMRDRVGSFSIASKKEELASKLKFKFDFIITKTAENKLDNEPTGEDCEPIGTELDEETEKFLAELEKMNHLSARDKARRCVSYTKKRLRYPENEEMESMNKSYRAAGSNFLNEILAQGIADCHWSNIFCGELCHRLGIAQRVATGFYVKKDPRFDFAALAGTGHAWTEVWDEERSEWIRMDATPSKQNEEEEQEQEDSEESEGDYGDQEQEEKADLTPEEIEELFEELLQQAQEEKDPSVEIFEQKEGVSYAKWQAVERFIQGVNQTVVKAEDSIRNKQSTIQEEWKELFKLIYEKREIPQTSFRGPVRQSEGDFLDDPVMAYVDIKGGEPDPEGFKVESKKVKEVVEATEFEEDEILDLTASMEGFPAEQQKAMVLTSAYNMMQLNNKLQMSHYANNLRTPLRLRKRVASFFGASGKAKHLDSEEEIDKKTLCKLYDKLSETKMGAGDLAGALVQYKADLSAEVLQKIKKKKLVKVLTVVSDGEVNDQDRCVQLIQELRGMGIKVQGLGFGQGAQTIKVICHDPQDPSAAKTLDDVSQAALARHQMLVKHLKLI